ncbi:hypothetical protein [Sinorhizobium psoraleae]|uniref:hypothetical protein n=1 Tax=Sinorhizobium psoraleae TaxID=520838 RepID=UPI001568BD8E|nr:hypothetical protein [Sinorhizobium psoraleae]
MVLDVVMALEPPDLRERPRLVAEAQLHSLFIARWTVWQRKTDRASNKCVGIPTKPLIAAAARALDAGDPRRAGTAAYGTRSETGPWNKAGRCRFLCS